MQGQCGSEPCALMQNHMTQSKSERMAGPFRGGTRGSSVGTSVELRGARESLAVIMVGVRG